MHWILLAVLKKATKDFKLGFSKETFQEGRQNFGLTCFHSHPLFFSSDLLRVVWKSLGKEQTKQLKQQGPYSKEKATPKEQKMKRKETSKEGL